MVDSRKTYGVCTGLSMAVCRAGAVSSPLQPASRKIEYLCQQDQTHVESLIILMCLEVGNSIHRQHVQTEMCRPHWKKTHEPFIFKQIDVFNACETRSRQRIGLFSVQNQASGGNSSVLIRPFERTYRVKTTLLLGFRSNTRVR
jgi:hypothetical protein